MATITARWVVVASLALCAGCASAAHAEIDAPMAFIDAQIAANARKSGVYVLDTGAEALLARAWLAEHAKESIEVQYFIWSTDNIGILAAEALLRAAERGVRVRVIVDDLLIDAPDKSLLALALHPNIDIRIYNPRTSVGVPLQKRLLNVVTDFRGVNQRMHDKTLVVDGKVAITGGRNMAAEYFDYNHEYNFRDRDALLLGEAVKSMQASFESFWNSELSVKVEELYDGLGLMKKNVRVDDVEIKEIYRQLHEYAKSPENFAPEVQAAIAATRGAFARLARQMTWGNVEFISDRPGKNDNQVSLGGGGQTTSALVRLVGAHRDPVALSRAVGPGDGPVSPDRRARRYRAHQYQLPRLDRQSSGLQRVSEPARPVARDGAADLRVQARPGRTAQADAALSGGEPQGARLFAARQDPGD